MGRVRYPTADYSKGSFAFGEDVYEDINRIYTEFNGNIEAVNLADNSIGPGDIANGSVTTGKLTNNSVINSKWSKQEVIYDGIPAWLFEPNYPGSGGGLIMRVLATAPLSSGASPKSITYIYNGVDGSPTFTEIPTFLGAPIIFETAGDVSITAMRVTAKTTRHVTIEFTYTGDATVGIYFSLAGGI